MRDHDPRLALVPAEGVASLYARLLERAADFLRPGGGIVVEIGAGMERRIAEAMRHAALSDVSVRADLQGIARVVAGRRADDALTLAIFLDSPRPR